MLRVDNVLQHGEAGNFRANAENLGWRSADGTRMVVRATAKVRRAAWREGRLRVLCEAESGSGEEVLALDGFPPGSFEEVWRYFQHHCSVHVEKHRAIAEVSEEDFDGAMRGIEEAADSVDEVPAGSVLKKAREADLMKRVEGVRDGLDQAVSGDKQALSRVFAANGCERIGRLRLVVDTVQLEVYDKDPRWLHLLNRAATIEAVLKELGSFRRWLPPEGIEHSSLLRRQLLRELQRRRGAGAGEEEEDEEEEDAAPQAFAARGPPPGRLRLEAGQGMPPPPLHGLLPAAAAPVPLPPGPAEPAAPAEAADSRARAQARRGGSLAEEDWDEEVTDPNAVKASAPDDRRLPVTLAGNSSDNGGQRVRYIYPNSILEGWVWKRSQFLRRWRRRWLVLMPDHLATYKSRNPGGATEQVAKGSVVRIYSADGEVLHARSFCIVALHKKYFVEKQQGFFMVCDDEAQKRDWMREIAQALGTQAR